ncbi:MAG: response regulator [Verrucomicrobiota bacterium]
MNSKTILIVDDEADLTSLMRGVLETAGYRALVAINPAEALEAWNAHKQEIDVVLMDIHLVRRLGALDLAQRMQAEVPAVKFVYSSSHAPAVFGNPALVEGRNFLQKPFGPAELLDIIANQFPPG